MRAGGSGAPGRLSESFATGPPWLSCFRAREHAVDDIAFTDRRGGAFGHGPPSQIRVMERQRWFMHVLFAGRGITKKRGRRAVMRSDTSA